MHTIIINAEMEELKDVILEDLIQVMNNHGISCETAHPASNVIVIYPKLVDATPAAEPAVIEPVEEPTEIVAALPVEEPAIVGAEAAVQEPIAPIMCKVMSLSTNTAVPVTISQESVSSLLAQDVQVMGEFVLFNFCGNVYKYPAEPQSGSSAVICNTSTEYSNRNIRVALQFEGSETTYPVVLAVAEQNDLPFSIVLGKDLSELINTLSLGSSQNGEIPA
jgi:hypothetical protein